MKPSEYKAHYENLRIHLGDGDTTTVAVRKYRLGQPTDGGVKRTALQNKVGKGVKDFELRVGLGDGQTVVDAEFTKTGAFRTALASPYTGKGAPEHSQLVLQLVNHFFPGTDLQQYADDHLGLDCNGFVGNYLWHAVKGKPWTNPGRGEKDYDGPDMRLDGFFDIRRKNRVKRWSDINTNLTYLYIRTRESGDIIIAPSGDPIGHIVISDAGMAPRPASASDPHFGVRVVESTGSHVPPGLSESWYRCIDEKNVGTANAIFRVDRGDGFGGAPTRKIWFLIVSVEAAPSK